MTEFNKYTLILAVTLIFSSYFGLLISSQLDDSHYETKETKCYDKYGNEIVGEICLEKEFVPAQETTLDKIFGISLSLGFILFAMALISTVIDEFDKRRKENE